MRHVNVNGLLPTSSQDPIAIIPTAIHEGDAVSQPGVYSVTRGLWHVNSIFSTVGEILPPLMMNAIGFGSLPTDNARISHKFNVKIIWPNTRHFATVFHIDTRSRPSSTRKRPLNVGRNGISLLGMNMAFHPL